MRKQQGVEVQCIVCKDTRLIDREEAARLTEAQTIPMCDKCYMPMVATRAFA